MFKKLLVANRGTIAIRIIRACRELGIQTIAIYSTADKDSLHIRMADESVCIGPASTEDSYLNIPSIVSAAMTYGADAVHPGYGFLSENGDFAEACKRSGINFVGPRARHIRLMGDKPRARRIMKRAGVPVLPGSEGIGITELRDAVADAKRLGFPVLIKAAAGGGGKGMRVVRDEAELTRLFPLARAESEAAFGSRTMYLEKYLERAVESCLAQTHRNIELIAVDDASTDRSAEILEKFAARDRRVLLLSNRTNQGLPRSLNVGFGRSTGELLTWTSDDNWMSEDAIECLARYLSTWNDVEFVYSTYVNVDERGHAVTLVYPQMAPAIRSSLDSDRSHSAFHMAA